MNLWRIASEIRDQYGLNCNREFWEISKKFASDNECRHEMLEAVVSIIADGRTQIRNQCLNCGDLIGPALKQDPRQQIIRGADPSIAERFIEKWEAGYIELCRQFNMKSAKDESVINAEYAEYLMSQAWRDKRQKVMDRAGGICEGCRNAKATQVHHLTYAHIFDELLFELVAVCDDCHSKAHEGEKR